MVASGAVCGNAFPGNGLPVRGLWSLIPVLVAFPLILCQQPPVTDRLPRHSIRVSSNGGGYFIVPVQACVSRRVCSGLTKFNRDKIVQITEVLLAESGEASGVLFNRL